MKTNDLVDRWFRDSSGRMVIAQFPNLPLFIWGFAWALDIMIETKAQSLSTGLNWLGFFALCYWAWLEITQGVNRFRKALGWAVILLSGSSRLIQLIN